MRGSSVESLLLERVGEPLAAQLAGVPGVLLTESRATVCGASVTARDVELARVRDEVVI